MTKFSINYVPTQIDIKPILMILTKLKHVVFFFVIYPSSPATMDCSEIVVRGSAVSGGFEAFFMVNLFSKSWNQHWNSSGNTR